MKDVEFLQNSLLIGKLYFMFLDFFELDFTAYPK